MSNVMLRPDLKTVGGEVSDILFRGQYVGTINLVFREQDRISGTIQLDKESVSPEHKEEIIDFLHNYVQTFIDAIQADSCDVLVTYSRYEDVISTDDEMDEEDMVMADADALEDWTGTSGEMGEEVWASSDYELVTTRETRSRIDYHVFDGDRNWLAEIFLNVRTSDITGEVNWADEPTDVQIEEVTELLVSDFDEDSVDTFVINHLHNDEIVETVELTHEDLLDTPVEIMGEMREDDYSVILVRDDGDMLTYEIYQQSQGGLPIGTASVDIEQRQLTGFIDFREESNGDDAEIIASLLMRELDKEKEYDALNLTLIYQNRPIEEIRFENETVH